MKHMEGPWGTKQASSSPCIPGTVQRGHWGRHYMMQINVNTGCSVLHCWAHVQCIDWPCCCGACIFTQLQRSARWDGSGSGFVNEEAHAKLTDCGSV